MRAMWAFGLPARLVLATLGFSIIFAGWGTAAAQPAAPWMTLVSATFKILADVTGWSVRCTGWYAAPHGHVGSMVVSVYVTAGHCDVPHIVRIAEGFEQMAVLARITRPGVDAAVGARLDPRAVRSFLPLATVLPSSGERALVAGYSAGRLTEAVLTVLPACRNGFLCLESDHRLRPGMSGAPIVSLRTGEVIGILVGTPLDAHGYEDTHTVWATPSRALQALVELAAPGATRSDSSPNVDSPLFKLQRYPGMRQ